MNPGSRKSRPSRPFTCLLLLAAAALAAGCSDANTSGGGGTSPNHVLPSGSSVPGWTVPTGGSQHAIAATNQYVSGGTVSSCADCHGADLSGGISKASCFGPTTDCHHGTMPGWINPLQHGASAKRAPGSSSFFSCQICHGKNFQGDGSGISCFACHTLAPHPDGPWRNPAGSTHTDTSEANAPVCAQCHFPGSPNNPPGHPATPAPAGTPPGCSNNTLCHGPAGAPHPLGNPAWFTTPPAAQPHGTDAKAPPGAAAGLAYCKVCHGTGTTPPGNFGGTPSGTSCYPCHGVSAPHAPAPWRASGGSVYDHTDTSAGNAPICAQCHFPGSPSNPPNHPPQPPAPGAPPDCFNNTLCHAGGTHPAGWAQSSQHGPAAKDAPSVSAGFAFCQSCHGTGTTPPANFGGVPPAVSCYTCHGLNAPHSSAWAGGAPAHRSTDPGNAAVCFQCHQTGNAGTPDCFNNTLCHN
jgi:hypothetical protein